MRRLRKFILITAALLSLLIAATFVASARWRLWLQFDTFCITIANGHVGFQLGVAGWFEGPVKLEWFPGMHRWNFWSFRRSLWVHFPLYPLFLAVAIPTLLAWRFWPKPVKPGHCRCGKARSLVPHVAPLSSLILVPVPSLPVFGATSALALPCDRMTV